MRYHVTLGADSKAKPAGTGVGSTQHVVDLVELPNGTLQMHVDGRLIEVDALRVGNQLTLRIGGQVIDLTTRGTPPDFTVSASGHRLRVHVESDRFRFAENVRKVTAKIDEKVVKSPMPGRVVKVLVAKGDEVQAGQGLVVLEAMKMENEVRARAPGTVAQVLVTAGAAVDGNTILVILA